MRMSTPLSALTLALLALCIGQASAQNTGPKTRAEVQAELREAIRTGNMPAAGDQGCLLNEINPSAYPAKPVASSKTREQVKAELEEAKRTGNMPANDESGRLLKDVYPHLYPKK